MKTQIFNHLIAVSLLVSLTTACNFKKVETNPHEGAQDTELTIKEDQPKLSRAENQTLDNKVKTTDLQTLYTKANSIKTESDAVSAIKDLEASLINKQVWSSPNHRNLDNVIHALSYYNYSVIRLLEIAPDSQAANEVSDRYQAMALENCDENLQSCTNIQWLKRDARSNRVIELIVSALDKKIPDTCSDQECQKSLKKYYNFLAIGMATSNASKNLNLQALYLKRASQYASLFKVDSTSDANFFKRHGQIFENIIANYPMQGNDKNMLEIVKKFKPWSYSRKQANVFPFGADKMFAFASQHLLYEGNNISPELKKAIVESQEKDDDVKSESSAESANIIKIDNNASLTFKHKLKALKNSSDSRQVFSGLKFDTSIAESDSFYNEYFFMVDRLYREHLNLEEVGNIWKGSKKNQEILGKTVATYIKVELINMMIATNKYFSSIISAKNVTNDMLFKRTINESQRLTQTWENMYSRVDKLSIFLGQYVKDENSTVNKEVKEASEIISGLARNVKFLSVYPNMLLLGYFMINANAGLSFNTWWGTTITIDPTTIVNYMLNGGFEQPWFPFSGNSSPLNKTEIIYAFYYALNAGAFETFSVIKDEKDLPVLDRLSFVKKALKKTIGDDLKELIDGIKDMTQFRNGDSNIPTLMEICSKLSANKYNFNVVLKLEELQEYSIFGSSEKGLLRTAAKFYSKAADYYSVNPNSPPGSLNNILRTRIQSRLVQIKSMLIPLIENINSLSTTEAEKSKNAKLIAEINAEVNEVEDLMKSFLKESIKLHREIDQCSDKLVQIERQRQGEIFTLEVETLGKIYDAMKIINSTPIAEREAKAKELHKQLGLGSTESISGSSYVYSRYDLLNRIAAYESKMQPSVSAEQPATLTKDSLSAETRQVAFISLSTGTPISKEAFVSDALSKLNSQGTNTIGWLRDILTPKFFDVKIAALVSLYRLGFDLGLDQDPKQSISINEIIDETIASAKYMNISDSEATWLKIMKQNELVPKDLVRGVLFDQTENDYYGILDSVYFQLTRIEDDLLEAQRYYIESKNMGSLIFPVSPEMVRDIDENYFKLVRRSERLISTVIAAVTAKEKQLDPKDLEIAYRIEDGKPVVYSPLLIDGGISFLVKTEKKNDGPKRLENFHHVKTFNFYREGKK